APVVAREPGAAAATRLRGSALDRHRDPDPARQPGREPAHGPHPAAGQLPTRVSARLGQQDLLHATAARPTTARQCPPLLACPAGGRTASCTTETAPDRADRWQSLLPGGECADPGGDGGAGR